MSCQFRCNSNALLVKNKEPIIPRTIWILWHQGLSNAPFIVKKCIDSWYKENPEWEIIVLDADTVHDYVHLAVPEDIMSKLSLAHQSDLVRLALLSKHGGIWADATTFCVKPLDSWIHDHSKSGFFAFDKPTPDKLLSNWFLATSRECPIPSRLYEELVFYWSKINFTQDVSILQRTTTQILSRILNHNEKMTRFWFSPIVTKHLHGYPYFVFHYLFAKLVEEDDDVRKAWVETEKINAAGPHTLQEHGMLSPLSETLKKQIDDQDVPLYKLTYKYDHSSYSPDTSLYYLLQGR